MLFLALAAATLAAAQVAPLNPACLTPEMAASPRGPVPDLKVRTMEPALRAWEREAAGTDSAARIAAFRRLVVDAWPDIYGPVFARPGDAALWEYLAWLTPRLPSVYRLFAFAGREVAPASRRVAAVLPSLATAPVPIVLGLSLGRTNGTVRLVNGAPHLFLGLDVQSFVSEEPGWAAALVEHELVHVAHARANLPVYQLVDDGVRGLPTPVFVSLFSEGLAAWATGCVSPGRPVAERLMSSTLDAEASAAAGRLLPEFSTVLEATDPAGYADWFFLGGKRNDIPPRFAYWAGERMVGEIAKRMSPAALLQLDRDGILRETRVALTALSRTGGPAPHE